MKGIFMTAAIATAIVGNAFGAASVRAPQLSGGAVATPATTSVARAGSMRAQTMKTTSTATPVTTADVETPVASDATDARLSFLSSKLGKINVKTTDAAKQEINNIDARINELTAKLDQAEAVQQTVVKEAEIDSKIDEKLAAQIEEKLATLEAQSSAKDTYSKTEIDNLLAALEEKIPEKSMGSSGYVLVGCPDKCTLDCHSTGGNEIICRCYDSNGHECGEKVTTGGEPAAE